MQIVIEIPEIQKKMIDAFVELPPQVENDLISAIRHGTPLPKHDRLIDATVAAANIEAARYELSGEYEEGLHEAWEIVNSEDVVPTIIPATGNEFFNFDAPIIKKQTVMKEKSCENCANLNKYTGCLKHIECQREHLKYFELKQTETKEGEE